ncbi:MAG: hypothetical protein Q9195_001591 [Heterodermia aff. obscurata]
MPRTTHPLDLTKGLSIHSAICLKGFPRTPRFLHTSEKSHGETFTGLPLVSERFSTSAALQYYAVLPSLEDLTTYVQQKICSRSNQACSTRATSLESADYLDIDFDTISQALVLNIFHGTPPKLTGWTEKISKPDRFAKVEVGILAPESPTQPEELSLGGFLTVLGEDSKASEPGSIPCQHMNRSV